MNVLCASLLLAASLVELPEQTRVQGVELSLKARHDSEAITFTVRTSVHGVSQFLFNPQLKSHLGVPGRLDVYNERGKYLGDVLPALDPFMRLGALQPHHWFYLHDTGVIESQLRFRLSELKAFKYPNTYLLQSGETFTFQLVADERFLSTPSVVERFRPGSKEEKRWQRGFDDHKVLIRTKPIRIKIPPQR